MCVIVFGKVASVVDRKKIERNRNTCPSTSRTVGPACVPRGNYLSAKNSDAGRLQKIYTVPSSFYEQGGGKKNTRSFLHAMSQTFKIYKGHTTTDQGGGGKWVIYLGG